MTKNKGILALCSQCHQPLGGKKTEEEIEKEKNKVPRDENPVPYYATSSEEVKELLPSLVSGGKGYPFLFIIKRKDRSVKTEAYSSTGERLDSRKHAKLLETFLHSQNMKALVETG